jgi:hypothetical protein
MRDASFINDIADDMEDPLRTMTADSQSDIGAHFPAPKTAWRLEMPAFVKRTTVS